MAKEVYTAESLGEELKREYSRWDEIYCNGGSDPFCTDGCSLWLIRNHIIHFKRLCEEYLSPEEYPEEYHEELPPDVEKTYMAQMDEIIREADEMYEKLASVEKSECVSDKAFEVVRIQLGFLKNAQEKKDLVEMRRWNRFGFRYWDKDQNKEQSVFKN